MNATTQSESTAVALKSTGASFDLSPRTFEQALTFADYLADSDMVPKDFKGKPGNCLIAMQWGCELGLKPLQSLQNLAVINGRPALWGDAVIALVRSSPACEYVIETQTATEATCRVKRRGEPEQERAFSMADAKAAGLAGKQGPWTQYPKRMMQMRARAFALRDVFPDVLRGLPVAEEVMDYSVSAAAPEAPKPEVYPSDQFEKNLPAWLKVIADGRKTPDQIIAMAQSKFPMTEEQKAKVRAGAKAVVEDAKVVNSLAESIERGMRAAINQDELDEAAGLIDTIQDEHAHQALVDLYSARVNELNKE